MNQRIVEVDVDFYVKLATFLEATERWATKTELGYGLTLLDPMSGNEIIFVAKREKHDG